MRPSLTVLHAADLQCGRPYSVRAGNAFVRFARELSPDVIVIAGDLTQRAKAREFRAAAALIERLPDVPKVVTPGNHDVPLYRLWERAVVPYRNWRAFVSPELNTATRVQGAVFVALNSSAPRRAIVAGRLHPAQVDFARREFEETARGDLRALVVHHHFVATPDGKGGRQLPGAEGLMRDFESMGVDLVLGGHVHRTWLRSSRDVAPGAGEGIPLIACGTTTSRRGRGPESGVNSLNVVRVTSRDIEVVPHLLAEGAEGFEPGEAMVLPRRRGAEIASTGGAS